MTNIFDVVQAMSGHKNVIVIPVPYLEFFKGDQQAHALAAVLNQLVFWSGISSSASEGWFYKSHEELADEIKGISGEEQARRLVDKLRKKYFPGIIETKTKKVNGTPVTHYKLDGNALIAMIFPAISETSKVRNGNVESNESNRRKCGMETAEMQNHGNVEDADSYLYTDLNSDKNIQINKTLSSQNSNESYDTAESDVSNKNLNSVVSSANGQLWGTIEDLDVSKWMFKRVQVINPTQKIPKWFDWANDIRLMREVDGRNHEQICGLFDWANKDSFWFKNILCPRSLRKHFDTLTIKSQENTQQQKKQQATNNPECDKAFKRFLGQSLMIENPSELERLVRRDASNAGVKRMQAEWAHKKWVSIWNEYEQRLGGAA
ncbi:MAG: replication protein 15 [Providencia sp.]|uniref:replication protein 15 n=1 Tax=Providencia sp. TaxID=589 RepID=UPI003F9AF6BD